MGSRGRVFRIGAPVVAAAYAALGAVIASLWIGGETDPGPPSIAGFPLLVVAGGVVAGVFGVWSVRRQPRATVFALVMGFLEPTGIAFPLLCLGLLIAPLFPRSATHVTPDPEDNGSMERSERACPVCGEHRVRAVPPPRIDVQGVAPWLDLYMMGDTHPTTPLEIACDACGAEWPDLAAFEEAAAAR